ncbi:MAG TPA: GrpB family protein [Armatimonadota bacterium]|jgi:GrpB-like predicted nucleotidyltransferase (UPF0157 family)
MIPQSNEICLRFIGGLLVNTYDAEYRWFTQNFHRVMHEVRHTGEVIHFVRYGSHRIQFAGVEVEQIVDIPDGLVAWEFCDDTWTMRRASGEITWQAPITWQWRSLSANGRWLGEFSARCPAEWGGGWYDFQLTANSYVKPDAPCEDEITLAEADPRWPQQYAEFAVWLREALGPEVAVRIEHYGSTAIPGIPAKPVIDVLVEVPSFTVARQCVLPLLHGEAWEYWWYHDHMLFIKRQALLGRRTHHIHLAPAGHQLWEGLAFRDYLIAHPEVAVQYAALKRELAVTYREDREGYTQAKTAFVQEMTAKGLKETAYDGITY